MICKNFDRVLTAIQIVTSMFERHDNGQQFIIINFITDFHINHLLWSESHRMPADAISAYVFKWLQKNACEHKVRDVDFQPDR